MKLNKAQELAEQAIYEHTSSTKWQEVKYMKWTTSEMQDVIAKALVKNLSLSGVSQHRELLAFVEEVSEFDALVSSTRLRLRAKELLKANCANLNG
jgi:hypothetical protein